jgi:drug/metabolite transporter superfamily protein YnfA
VHHRHNALIVTAGSIALFLLATAAEISGAWLAW